MTRAGLDKLTFPVHSDPSWSLMTLKPKDIYVNNPSPAGIKTKKDGSPTGRPDYRMVQPAVVIVDGNGGVRFWWSWNKLQDGPIFKFPNGKIMKMLPNGKSAKNPTGNTHDVRWRPVPSDILARIKSGAADLGQIVVDNIGGPNGKDHKNPMGLNFKPSPSGYATKQSKL